MDPTLPFEKLNFNPFATRNNLLLNNLSDPDVNLFNENNFQDTPYLDIDETKNTLSFFKDSNSFHILHINIRSINKKFEKLESLLTQCDIEFSIICVTEPWCTDDSYNNNSNFNCLIIIQHILKEKIIKRVVSVSIYRTHFCTKS